MKKPARSNQIADGVEQVAVEWVPGTEENYGRMIDGEGLEVTRDEGCLLRSAPFAPTESRAREHQIPKT